MIQLNLELSSSNQANGKGGYIEFSHPEYNIKVPQGPLGNGNAGKIPTRVPLNIRNANPTYKYWNWWRWFR